MTELLRRPGPGWALYEAVAMVIGLGSLALLCLGWAPVALTLTLTVPRPLGRFIGRRMIAGGFRFYLWLLEKLCACRFDLTALDQLRQQQPLIVAANHPSLLDAVMILSCLPNAVCVMKAALMDNVLFGAAARLACYIRNDAPLEMMLHARAALLAGGHLVIFPEGTRTVAPLLNPCSLSTALISKHSGVPIQTLLIEFSSPYLGKRWPLFRRPVLPLSCRIRLGQRFAPPEDAAAFTRELETYFRHALEDPLAQPVPATSPLATSQS